MLNSLCSSACHEAHVRAVRSAHVFVCVCVCVCVLVRSPVKSAVTTAIQTAINYTICKLHVDKVLENLLNGHTTCKNTAARLLHVLQNCCKFVAGWFEDALQLAACKLHALRQNVNVRTHPSQRPLH